MPLIIEGSGVPTRWLERKSSSRVASIGTGSARSQGIRIGIINNMPDTALEDTELQFFDLLDAGSEDIQVIVRLFSLTGVPRTDRGMRHLNSFYSPLEELWDAELDALIVTGTEPQQANLKREPYWGALSDVLDWAERNTSSTVLSCLAAHASVLHADGVERQRLNDKRFGVFDFVVSADHALMRSAGQSVSFPHSRWNEVPPDALRSAGYTVLTESTHAGVDCFVKAKKKSLFVHFQGHPEYNEDTLLKEYRRDIKRFLRQERETYPTQPFGYFDEASTRLLSRFREKAVRRRSEESIADFPDGQVVQNLRKVWQSSALLIYRNWLQYVLREKGRRSVFIAIPSDRSAESEHVKASLRA